ncbi:hypothetical protein [Solibacillus sp. CAU 1738]|uniref:hypothetical protein n=1 Tax=Solibacillus sp. CAU 1738 TaxID=3140363 RepID=UPI003260988E
MRIMVSFLLTGLAIFGTFGLRFNEFPNKFLIIAALVLGLHLAGVVLIQLTQKQAATQIISYLTLFLLILLVPCFATLIEFTKPMSVTKWTRYLITFPAAYIILFITVVASYRYYFIEKA